jgi:SAM-dependent methyltransferase
MDIKNFFKTEPFIKDNIISFSQPDAVARANQDQTADVFSEKWTECEKMEDVNSFYDFQKDWFLKLYGFASEKEFADFLKDKKSIVDTGCGLGYKAAWFAELAPHASVFGVDISDAVDLAAKNFKGQKNLYFIREDIANTSFRKDSIDFVVCDQVIMHTEVPEQTFKHLAGITSENGIFACYVYSKKALPRELVDDYFRTKTHEISNEKMWEFSEQLTILGKTLSDLKVKFLSPDIPALGIKGGEYDIQRFIYWNFLKCFWRDEWSFELNKSINYDWYAPSNAKRFSKEEFLEMVKQNDLDVDFLHAEEACYSGRFKKA